MAVLLARRTGHTTIRATPTMRMGGSSAEVISRSHEKISHQACVGHRTGNSLRRMSVTMNALYDLLSLLTEIVTLLMRRK